MNTELHRTSTAEAVVNWCKEQLAKGELLPGQQLPSERQLQENFGISRFALREGLARLSALGILRIVHGKGAFVTDRVSSASLSSVLLPAMSADPDRNLRDLFEARLLIETELARFAASRHTQEHLADLDEILARTGESLDNAEQFGALDYAFHQSIAHAAGNVFLRKMLDALSEQVRTFLAQHAQSPASRTAALRTHRDIVQAVRAGDADSAAAIMARHLKGCKSNYESRSQKG
jgi:GntR family transcriptional regulator, transcriptional repressor for pyruvate dehydrogenase complex